MLLLAGMIVLGMNSLEKSKKEADLTDFGDFFEKFEEIPKIFFKNSLDKSYIKWRSLQEEVRKLRDDFIDQEEDGMVDYPPGIAAF